MIEMHMLLRAQGFMPVPSCLGIDAREAWKRLVMCADPNSATCQHFNFSFNCGIETFQERGPLGAGSFVPTLPSDRHIHFPILVPTLTEPPDSIHPIPLNLDLIDGLISTLHRFPRIRQISDQSAPLPMPIVGPRFLYDSKPDKTPTRTYEGWPRAPVASQ
ncbi:hypothetical protein BDV32DRAFT_59674 [Aspergillus pseudonomiae]|uniref:Uncharacterized protein n=1 Tax=Aspergillus pseudonomiae TaxID=1506151 RepID=A0A5N7DF20_9EURO|nr:uncharacterized protein BDV37DRAFT_101123 [Aspergillus pseudonomiae]KAB8259227.1 hypothetical protein BDV32DRAFT_59674 [Aspergillus pseudonomiae]KAE8404977.1 hypothetical protein BDV37DRAFT_101123 [Aspergillus pseudonomiae]